MLPPNNNHPKYRQNAVFNWNCIYSEKFLIHKKDHPFQNPWILWEVVAIQRGVIGEEHCIHSQSVFYPFTGQILNQKEAQPNFG